MFDKYIVCEENFRSLDDGVPGGVVEVRMPYYRGLGLSMVEAVDLTVDGRRIDPASLSVTVNGHRYAFGELAGKGDEYWFTTDPAVLHVPVETSPGRSHRVQLLLGLSIPYILTGPDRVPLVAPSATDKTLTAAGA